VSYKAPPYEPMNCAFRKAFFGMAIRPMVRSASVVMTYGTRSIDWTVIYRMKLPLRAAAAEHFDMRSFSDTAS
jgi:hypothetical protein